MSARAVLFDVDGTLIDSDYLHVDAWDRALTDIGHPVDNWRIQRALGMDSGMLIERLLGDDADALGESAKQGHAEHYLASADRLRRFAGARELLQRLAERGTTVVLATSATDDELERLLRVLDAGEAVSEVTSSGDVETAKPAPDVIEVALRKAGVGPEDAVFVGDAVWDVEAAKRAGVAAVGVCSGGIDEAALRGAGAIAVYDDVAALLADLDASPLA